MTVRKHYLVKFQFPHRTYRQIYRETQLIKLHYNVTRNIVLEEIDVRFFFFFFDTKHGWQYWLKLLWFAVDWTAITL